jgi:enoyl-CoA hydratase
MAYENLLYEKRDGIAFVTFNRPKVLNALNRKTMEELQQVLLDARGDEGVRVLILTGAGEKSFVAGADIGELSADACEGKRVFDFWARSDSFA